MDVNEDDGKNALVGMDKMVLDVEGPFTAASVVSFIMGSFLVRGVGSLVCVALALAFGAMFLIGGVSLLKRACPACNNTAAVAGIEGEAEASSEGGGFENELVE